MASDFNLDDAINEATGKSVSSSSAPPTTAGNTSFDLDAAIADVTGGSDTANVSSQSDALPAKQKINPLESAALGVGKGVTGGFLPQLGGMASATLDEIKKMANGTSDRKMSDVITGRNAPKDPFNDPRYTSARDAIKEYSADSAEQNPVSDIGGQLVGSLIPASKIAKGAKVLGAGNTLAGAATGATLGGANAGANANWDDMPQALKDVIAGMGLGGTLGAAGGALSGVGGKIRSMVTPKAVTPTTAPVTPQVAPAPITPVPQTAPVLPAGVKAADFFKQGGKFVGGKAVPGPGNPQPMAAPQMPNSAQPLPMMAEAANDAVTPAAGRVADWAANKGAGYAGDLVRGMASPANVVPGMRKLVDKGIKPVEEWAAKKASPLIEKAIQKPAEFAGDVAAKTIEGAGSAVRGSAGPFGALDNYMSSGQKATDDRRKAMAEQSVKKEDQ